MARILADLAASSATGIYRVEFAPSPLWDFALAIYTRSGVEPLCLRLQDNHAVNIPVLLFARWLEARQQALDLPAVLACVTHWDSHYVQVLRGLRRQMKRDYGGSVELLREQIKRVELLAERQELDWLEQLARDWPRNATLAAGDNLRVYLGQLGVPELVIVEAIASLA